MHNLCPWRLSLPSPGIFWLYNCYFCNQKFVFDTFLDVILFSSQSSGWIWFPVNFFTINSCLNLSFFWKCFRPHFRWVPFQLSDTSSIQTTRIWRSFVNKVLTAQNICAYNLSDVLFFLISKLFYLKYSTINISP